MSLSIIRGGSEHGDFEHVVSKSIEMLGLAHHSFNLATQALLTDTDAEETAREIRETDRRINRTEQRLRSDLMGHVSTRGGSDIETVLGFTLLLKKIERVGDFAKDILELNESGVCLASTPESEMLMTERETVSGLFSRAAELMTMGDPGTKAVQDYVDRVDTVIADCQARIDSYMVSEQPASEVVGLAIYYRFMHRIAANLLGVVRASAEPVNHIILDESPDEGESLSGADDAR